MLKTIKKIDNAFNSIYSYLSILLLAIVIIATAVQVFTRYIMNASLSGTEEIARFAFIWMSMMGASICVRTHGHAVVSILNDSLKKKGKAQKSHDMIIQILIIIGSVVLLVFGAVLAGKTGAQKSAGLGIPMSYTYACIPFGAFGMILNAVVNILEDIQYILGGASE